MPTTPLSKRALLGYVFVLGLLSAGCPKASTATDGGVSPAPAQGGASAQGGTPGSVEGKAQPSIDAPRAIDAQGPIVNLCTTPADCALAGACPADALSGCTCVSLPQGRACLARCFAASDCPKDPEAVFGCSAAGLCIPTSQITLDAGPRNRPPSLDANLSRDAVDGEVGAPDTGTRG